ncbi:MAG: MFS transporter [Actinomycetota bacterium]|nr:MFS transporter [Actinomycetota bacterium]
MTPAPRPLWRGRALAVAGIVLLAFSLRSAVASLSPVLARVEADFDVPTWVVGVIGSVPPVCFAIFGLLTPALERRFGLERLALAALVFASMGMLGRALAPDASLLLLATALVFAACGVGNVLLPPLVKAYFADRIFLMTAIYTTVLSFAVFVPAFVAVPVADAAGWRISLAVWAALALIALIPWIGLVVRGRGGHVRIAAPDASALRRMARIPMAWALALAFGASSATVYTMAMWLPQLLADVSGLGEADAGVLLAVFGGMGLPLGLLVPLLVRRLRRIGPLFVWAIATGLIGVLGLMLVPTLLPWLWVSLLGIGVPTLFPLVLVLIGVRTQSHETAVALSGFAQSAGYAAAAAIPLAFGLLHELSGGWTMPLLMLAVMTVLIVPVGVVASRRRTIEQEWESRHGAW